MPDKACQNPHTKNSNIEFYDRFAPFYSQHYHDIKPAPIVKHWLAILEELRYIPRIAGEVNRKNIRLVDIGCGTGVYLSEWAREGFKVTGIDSSGEMLGIAEHQFRCDCPDKEFTLCRSDIREIRPGIYDSSFDIAVSHFNFLNLFPPDQLTPVFSGVHHILKPGSVWMTDFCELDGELENRIEDEDRLGAPSSAYARRSEHFIPAEGVLEIRWVVQAIDTVERYWLKHAQAIRQSAKEVGFKTIFLSKRPLFVQAKSEDSITIINQFITVFEKKSGNGPPDPDNLED